MPIPVPGRIAEAVRQCVVQVRTKRGSLGSGVVAAPGTVVTNAHVARGTDLLLDTWEGSTLTATVRKMSRRHDLALLSVPDLKAGALPLGDSASLSPGLPVFATGNPLGYAGAVSSGTIHSIAWPQWVCADVRLAPGNSGGPLTDFSGHMVGVNTMVVGGRLALAIPSRVVQRFLQATQERHLGINARHVVVRGQPGFLIGEIEAGSSAERGSLLPGDVLTTANGAALRHINDLIDAIDSAPGGLLTLEFYRGSMDQVRRVSIDLTEPAERTAA